MFPHATALYFLFKISVTNSVVVVFPFVPVIATYFLQNIEANSSSLIMVMLRSFALTKNSLSSGIDGDTIIKSNCSIKFSFNEFSIKQFFIVLDFKISKLSSYKKTLARLFINNLLAHSPDIDNP